MSPSSRRAYRPPGPGAADSDRLVGQIREWARIPFPKPGSIVTRKSGSAMISDVYERTQLKRWL